MAMVRLLKCVGTLLKDEFTRRFESRGEKITMVTEDGLWLRCAPPLAFDMEYNRYWVMER